MAKNRNLHQAMSNKKDKFYTQLGDIENELRHYTAHFRGAVVYCNCDDPRVSNFFHYFAYNFRVLGLKKADYHLLQESTDGYVQLARRRAGDLAGI